MKRAIFLTLAVLGLVAACAAIGLTLTPYVARKLGYFLPFRQTIVQGAQGVPDVIALVNAARSSVVLAADFIENKRVLEALQAAGGRKVAVAVVLSGAQAINTAEPYQGARAWLIERGIPVYVSKDPIRGFMLVADRSIAAICTSPVLSTRRMDDEKVPILIFEHKPTAESYFGFIRRWLPPHNGSP